MFDEEALERIREECQQWEKETVDTNERREVFDTDTAGTEVDRLYTPADRSSPSYLDDLGFPGEPPFTRGVYPTMYRSRFWTMRQYAGFGTPEATNERFRYLIDQGQTGLSMAFDLPTQMGYDSDDRMARGEVGRSGVAIDSLTDMERVFDGIPLDEVSTSMTINAPASVLLAMYIALGDRNGVSREDLRGTIQNDLLKEYVARNTYIYPPEPSMRIITDIFAFCADELPRFNPISISGYHVREAGATAAQEIAFTLGNAIEYVETAQDAGLSVDDFAPQLSFFFAAHNDIFEEAAKFRAARRLWADIVASRFGAEDPRSMRLKFHTQTAGSTLTAQQIDTNVVRVAYQALAAVLGGTQSLHTNSKDEALAIPTEDSVRTALRTQQVLAHESGVANTVDPLAGSYYVEEVTDRLEERARDILVAIDDQGGMLSAIQSEWVQREIQDVAYERQREIDQDERVIVGVNRFETDDEPTVDIQEVSEAEERAQTERLDTRRSNRDEAAVEAALEEVRRAARGSDNLMPPLIRAVKTESTVGEVCNVLREEFGTY